MIKYALILLMLCNVIHGKAQSLFGKSGADYFPEIIHKLKNSISFCEYPIDTTISYTAKVEYKVYLKRRHHKTLLLVTNVADKDTDLLIQLSPGHIRVDMEGITYRLKFLKANKEKITVSVGHKVAYKYYWDSISSKYYDYKKYIPEKINEDGIAASTKHTRNLIIMFYRNTYCKAE